MAWLQNLAGRAEDLLNKIDQNAATVLNDSISKTNSELLVSERQNVSTINPDDTNLNLDVRNLSFQNSSTKEKINWKSSSSLDCDGSINFTVFPDNPNLVNEDLIAEISEKPLKSSRSESGLSSSSYQNSFVLAEESQLLFMKIAKLEADNQDLQKQLLNLKHLYSEIKNENSNLWLQLERSNEQIVEAQNEKEQYKIRAQRILQEKEKLISIMEKKEQGIQDDAIIIKCNEELKHELETQQMQNENLIQRNTQLIREIQTLQMQHQVIQNDLQLTIQSLEQSLSKEREFKTIAEEDCLQKNNEINIKHQEIIQLQELLKYHNKENAQLKEAIKFKAGSSGDFESSIRNLTQTLMHKQNSLETVTTERNALKLQLEKLENEHSKFLKQLHRPKDKIVKVEEIDDSLSITNVLRVSPFDVGVTRRVKRAYSTLDAISVRTGIFLRRYPLARVLVFWYMVILHMWVLMILFWYAPSNQ